MRDLSMKHEMGTETFESMIMNGGLVMQTADIANFISLLLVENSTRFSSCFCVVRDQSNSLLPLPFFFFCFFLFLSLSSIVKWINTNTPEKID